MIKKIEVLIVDDNRDYTDILCDYFSLSQEINVVEIAHNGKEALQKIIELQPNLILLDMVMPIYDGISLLEKLKAEANIVKPKVIVISAIAQESYIKQALALNADYYLVKPFDLDVLRSRIIRLCISEPQPVETTIELNQNSPIEVDISKQIAQSLTNVGVLQHTLGYTYLKFALTLIINEQLDSYSMTKLIYPRVADKYETSSTCVDKAMRSVILTAFNHENMKLRKVLKNYNYDDNRPSNSEFLHILTNLIKQGTR